MNNFIELNEKEIGNKNIFLVMVGPSGSGKSTEVKNIKEFLEVRDKENSIDRKTVVLSSDAIRDELFGVDRVYDKTTNGEVFTLLHRRIKDLCSECNIIIDATNLTIKTRASLINCTKKNKNDIYYIAYVMTTPLYLCKDYNSIRMGVAKVPDEVIIKHIKAFEIPIYEEGFNDIVFQNYFNEKISNFKTGWKLNEDPLFKLTIGFDQKNPHHLYTLDEHTMKVVYGISNWSYKNKVKSPDTLIRAAILHDIGKIFTGEEKLDEEGNPTGHYRYKGHANYGTYYLLSELDLLGFNNKNDIIDCLALINYHMEPFAWRVEQKDGRKIVLPKTVDKMKKRYGKYYDLMVFFNHFDKLATGTETDDGEEYMKPKKPKKEKVKPQGLTKKQKKQLKKQRKKEEKRARREKKKQKELARQEYLAKKMQKEENKEN